MPAAGLRQLSQLLHSSFLVLRKNSALLIFVVLLTSSEFLLLGLFFLITLFLLHSFPWTISPHDLIFSWTHRYHIVILLIYSFVLISTEIILHAAALLYLWNHLNPDQLPISVLQALKKSITCIPLLAQWLFFHFSCAFFLNLFEWWIKPLAKSNEKRFGISWFIARYFIFPTIIIERLSPLPAWKRVGKLTLKKSWFPARRINYFTPLLYFLFTPLILVVFFLLFSHTTHLNRWLIGTGIYLAIILAIYQLLSLILQVVMYRYLALDESTQEFNNDILDNVLMNSLFC